MSAPLTVSIPHKLGREEAVRRLKTGLGRAAASIPVMQVEEERWNGDSMNFRIRALGQIATGQVDVADDHVKVQVVLPWLLQRFAEMAQATIRKRGQCAGIGLAVQQRCRLDDEAFRRAIERHPEPRAVDAGLRRTGRRADHLEADDGRERRRAPLLEPLEVQTGLVH